jgi:hypothetical protein
MVKKAGNSSSNLVEELDQLVHLLGDGPEYQHEIPMPQAEFDGMGKPRCDSGAVPVLTSIYDTDPVTGETAQLDALIEELIEELMPRFETLLRARLKARLKAQRGHK